MLCVADASDTEGKTLGSKGRKAFGFTRYPHIISSLLSVKAANCRSGLERAEEQEAEGIRGGDYLRSK